MFLSIQTLQLVVAVVIDLATTIIAIATSRSCYIATKLSDTKCRTKHGILGQSETEFKTAKSISS